MGGEELAVGDALSIEEVSYPAYSDYKEHVSRIRCVVCQTNGGKNADGALVEPVDYIPEVINLSDPAHVKSRGAGGPDAENIVPLCRFHHGEFHQIGIASFEARYNISLKTVAIEIYNAYESAIEPEEHARKAMAVHNRILAQVFDIKARAMRMGELLNNAQRTNYSGKPIYRWLGFTSFWAYVGAPPESGGLGLPTKTAQRWMRLCLVKEQFPDMPIEELGAHKADAIIPALRRAESETQQREIIEHAMVMSLQDTIAYSARLLDRPDRRQKYYNMVHKAIREFLQSIGVDVEEVPDKALEGLVWRIISLLGRASPSS